MRVTRLGRLLAMFGAILILRVALVFARHACKPGGPAARQKLVDTPFSPQYNRRT
ncbi:MAG TPA: hypothetical protein VJZ91_13575 [Blastocatellia bacterium]|nr:hypothetical protein [Blastocatellia bacterium]